MARAPILSLQTLFERPFISIDGKRYELRSPEELSISQTHRLGTWGKEAAELANSGKSEDEVLAACQQILDMVLIDVPPDVMAKLSGSQKLSIVEVFTGLLQRHRLGVAGAIAAARTAPQTGEQKSQGSAASTEASQPTGSTAPQGHS